MENEEIDLGREWEIEQVAKIAMSSIINESKKEYEKIQKICFEYAKIAPVATDMLGFFDGIYPENYDKRIKFFRSLSTDDFNRFLKLRIGKSMIEFANECRKDNDKGETI